MMEGKANKRNWKNTGELGKEYTKDTAEQRNGMREVL
jgi:hypothetical protein